MTDLPDELQDEVVLADWTCKEARERLAGARGQPLAVVPRLRVVQGP